MSQTQKKSGGRDISDLKARLGLKKGGPASKQRAAVVAPPGMKSSRTGAVPVPPGAQPPAPQLPSASDDPFAHMNALAAQQQAAAAPQIIVVNDGKPVEAVDAKSRAVTIGKWAGIVLVPLIIGIALGQISKTAKAVNKTIEHASVLHKDVNKIRSGLYDFVVTPFLDAQQRGGGKLLVNDEKLTEALDANLKEIPTIDPEVAFGAYMFDMDKTLVGDILAFYSGAAQLREDLAAHVDAAKADAQVMKDGDKKLAESKPFSRFGVFVEVPSQKEMQQGKQLGAKLVELGPPVCEDGKLSTTGSCGQLRGFGYREAGSGEQWSLKELALAQGDNVSGNKLVPLLPTQVLLGLVKTGGATAAEVAYLTRVNKLKEQADMLVQLGTSVEKTLKAKANQTKAFTFFL